MNQPLPGPEEETTIHRVGIACFAGFLLAFFVLLHWKYPATGHDFGSVFLKLSAGAWHFHHQGFAVPRFAVHLCGGSVLYGSAEDFFYSPTQILSLVMDPWFTIQLTILAALIVGYLGWYRVGCNLLRLPKPWSHLLALVVEANGFYFVQMLSGHLIFHSFALLGWFLLLVFESEALALRALARRAIAFAFLTAYTLYSGGWLVFYFALLGIVLVLPVDLHVSEKPRKRLLELLRRALLFAVASLALSGSKLVAVYSYMRHFSGYRPLDAMDPYRSALGYVARALWWIPQNQAVLDGAPGFVHEKSVLMSPVTLLGLIVGLVLLGRWFSSAGRGMRDRWFVVVYSTLAFTAMIHLVRGRGPIAEALHAFPVGAWQHLPPRYLYVFAVLLSAVAVGCLAKLADRLSRRWTLVTIGLLSAATVAAFVLGYGRMLPEVGLATDMKFHRARWQAIDRGRSVKTVKQFTEFEGETAITCQDPVLNVMGNPALALHEGSVGDVKDGNFNLLNPACGQYPAENRCKPGDRILLGDIRNFYAFTNGLPVTWQVSAAQTFADVVSLLSLLIFLVASRYLREVTAKKTREKPSEEPSLDG